MLPFTDPIVVPWAFAIDDRGDLTPVRDLRHNPLTPDPAESTEPETILQTLFAGRLRLDPVDPKSLRDAVEAIERMVLGVKGSTKP